MSENDQEQQDVPYYARDIDVVAPRVEFKSRPWWKRKRRTRTVWIDEADQAPTDQKSPSQRSNPRILWFIIGGVVLIGLAHAPRDQEAERTQPKDPPRTLATPDPSTSARRAPSRATQVDQAVTIALSATDWPPAHGIRREVRAGVRMISQACPAFPLAAIGVGLAEKYNTTWQDVEQTAAEIPQIRRAHTSPTEPVDILVSILQIVHQTMVADLTERRCGE